MNVRIVCPGSWNGAHESPQVIASLTLGDDLVLRPRVTALEMLRPAGKAGWPDEYRWRVDCPRCAKAHATRGHCRQTTRVFLGSTLQVAVLKAIVSGRQMTVEHKRVATRSAVKRKVESGLISGVEARRYAGQHSVRYLDLVLGSDL